MMAHNSIFFYCLFIQINSIEILANNYKLEYDSKWDNNSNVLVIVKITIITNKLEFVNIMINYTIFFSMVPIININIIIKMDHSNFFKFFSLLNYDLNFPLMNYLPNLEYLP